MSTPKPCPFCADVNLLVFESETPPYWVECLTEGCEADGPVRPTIEEAVAAWNNRKEAAKCRLCGATADCWC